MRIIFIGMLSAVVMGMNTHHKIWECSRAVERIKHLQKELSGLSKKLEIELETQEAAQVAVFRQLQQRIAERDAEIRMLREAARKAEVQSNLVGFTKFVPESVPNAKYAKISEDEKSVINEGSKCNVVRTGWIKRPTASPVEATVEITKAGNHFQLGVVAEGFSHWDFFQGCDPQGWGYSCAGSIRNCSMLLPEVDEELYDWVRPPCQQHPKLKVGDKVTIRVLDRTITWLREGIELASCENALPEGTSTIAFAVSLGSGHSARIVS